MAKKDRFIVTTPVVELGYGYLRTPDVKFNSDGDFKQDFFMTPEQAKEFCAQVESDPRAVTEKGKKAKLKFTKADGLIKFKTKQHTKVKGKGGEIFEIKPNLFYIVDGKTVPYPEDKPLPWSGSTGEVEVEVIPYDGFGGGLTLRLRAIRLHQIVEGGTGGGNNWAEVEDGYGSSTKERVRADDDDEDLDTDDDGEEDDDGEDRW